MCVRDDQTNVEICANNFADWNTANINWELADWSWNADVLSSELNDATDDYFTITFVGGDFNFVEGHFYDLKITDTDTEKVIYKDKMFCTDQDVNELTNDYYTINKNQYVTDSSFDDEVIIL